MNHSDRRSCNRRRRVGFTLIELLVVIAIIGLLAAILFPVFARARENARRASCQSNLKQIALSMFMYTQDFDEKMPYIQGTATNTNTPYGWADALQPYLKSTQILQCPSDKLPGSSNPTVSTNTAAYSDYWMNAEAVSQSHAAFAYPSETVLLGDGSSGNGGATYRTAAFNTDGCGHASGVYSVRSYYTISCNNTGGPLDAIIPFGGAFIHLDGGNFAFADGHVKWLKGSPVASGSVLGSLTDAVAPSSKNHANAGGRATFRLD